MSTRNLNKIVSFYEAVTKCLPDDGGLYIPLKNMDLTPWITYLNENSSFASIAGALTSAMLQKEFSPVISERIAATAFNNYSPHLRQIDTNLFLLDLYHGPTGCHRDFGFLWLASVLEHILTIQNKTAIVLATGTKKNGRSMAAAFGNKKHLKTLLIYPEGCASGIKEEFLAENGGAIYCVECEGASIKDIEDLKRFVYFDKYLIEKYELTLANTVNIGRLLPQLFFYVFAFTRLKKKVHNEIYYALHSGNYGNITAGLYAWKNGLSLNGFFTNSTPELEKSKDGSCLCKTLSIPVNKRSAADPISPSNIERLEQIFEIKPEVMRGLIFPEEVSPLECKHFIKTVYQKYGLMIDTSTALAYGSAIKNKAINRRNDETLILVSKDHPAFESDTIFDSCGERPIFPKYMGNMDIPVKNVKKIRKHKTDIENMLKYMKR